MRELSQHEIELVAGGLAALPAAAVAVTKAATGGTTPRDPLVDAAVAVAIYNALQSFVRR